MASLAKFAQSKSSCTSKAILSKILARPHPALSLSFHPANEFSTSTETETFLLSFPNTLASNVLHSRAIPLRYVNGNG
jgi:hypothetical protein